MSSLPDNYIINFNYKTVLNAYKKGMFPMAESAESTDVFWVEPENRGVIYLKEAKTPKRLKRFLKKKPFKILINSNFEKVIDACAQSRPGRELTWINPSIKNSYLSLHEKGYAHSIECLKNNILIGGLYGVSLGGIFFGESMFSFETDASKVALIHLIERLKYGNFMIIDTQFLTPHLKNFGGREIKKNKFLNILKEGLNINANFFEYSSSGFLDYNKYPTGENFTS